MKTIRLSLFALALVFLTAGPAAANNPPGPQTALAEILILPLMMILSMAGGAYGILEVLSPRKKGRWGAIGRWGGVILLILFSFTNEMLGLMVVLFFTIAAVGRGLQMLRWGMRARSAGPRPAHLETANPRRLIPAGGLLVVITLVLLVGVAVGLVGENLQSQLRYGYSRAAGDTKTAVTQAIVYAKDKGVYPTSIKVLREAGYANISDKDPWGNDWVLSPVLTQGGKAKADDDVYVYSKGPKGTGTYPRPFTNLASARGSIGYSSIYGAWRGE